MPINKPLIKAIRLIPFLFMQLSLELNAEEYLMCTDLGPIELEIYSNESPRHANNFDLYVKEEFFTGLVFHRVVENFVIQSGGYNRYLSSRLEHPPIEIETDNGLTNERGTIAAARTNDPDSASSQFFVNLSNNGSLNPRRRNPGYTVFGAVTSGMGLVDLIGSLPTGADGPLRSEVPSPTIAIRSIFPRSEINLDLMILSDDELTNNFNALVLNSEFQQAADLLNKHLADCGDINTLYMILKAQLYAMLENQEEAMRYLEEYFWFANINDQHFANAQTLYTELSFTAGDLSTRSLQNLLDNTQFSCIIPYSPLMPNGDIADLLDMQFARSAILEFSQQMDTLADCIDETQNERGISEEEELILSRAYYRARDINEAIQRRLNLEIQSFNLLQNQN